MTTMRELIAGLPDQLRWAAGLEPPEMPAATEMLVVGMGGSGIAGDIAGVVADAFGRRIGVHKSYGLPGWVGKASPQILAVSHSGNTEETLSSVDAALAAGLQPAVITTGGTLGEMASDGGWPMITAPVSPQPRAAVGHLAGAALRMAEAARLVPAVADDLLEAAAVVEMLMGDGDGPGVALAEDLAEALDGRVTVIYGGLGLASVAANRWKCQINENGKAPAYWSTLPELNHNEIVGWEAYRALSKDRIGIVTLHDRDAHPRVGLRAKLTTELVGDRVGIVGEVEAQGQSVVARLFSLMVIGDLLSVSIAERAQIDPMPVDIIQLLKQRLAEEEA
ncbi:MAG: bifunctional phosphoglucose/phosphomannose isomerase [Acidimicrobiia bacterium]|nr:bifunctional phosphoglucose/phosphomannose isomerase [Acidimicrobiia bacterium]